MWGRVFRQQLMLTRRFMILYIVSFAMIFLLTIGIYFSNNPASDGLLVLVFPKFNLFIGIYLLSIILTLITISNYRQEIYITRVRRVILVENITRILITESTLMIAWLTANIVGWVKGDLLEDIFQNLDQWILRIVYLFIVMNMLAMMTWLGKLIFRKKILAFVSSMIILSIALSNSMVGRFSIIYGMINENLAITFSIAGGILILEYVASALVILRQEF